MIFHFSKLFKNIESILAFVGYFVEEIVILNIGFGFVVLKSIWEHCLKIVFDTFSTFFKKCPRSVNNFRTEHLGDLFGIVGPLTSLKHPSEGVYPPNGFGSYVVLPSNVRCERTFVKEGIA